MLNKRGVSVIHDPFMAILQKEKREKRKQLPETPHAPCTQLQILSPLREGPRFPL